MLSAQQQELVCMRSAHVDCPRYRRAVAPTPSSHGSLRVPTVPRAIAASLVVLALSAGVSFGFVLQRGGIDLPANALRSDGVAQATAPTATAPAASRAVEPSASPVVTATAPPTEPPSQPPTAPPSASAPPTPEPTTAPAVTPKPSVPAASGGPSASRLAVLKPCPGQSGCYVYTIRSGDNLFSIAHWFGVPLQTIYTWNPTVKKTGIHPGMQIRIPTPTR